MSAEAISQFDEYTTKLTNIFAAYSSEEEAQSLLSEYQDAKSQELLQIMLFGSYNAGKSSLINALVKKEEVAPTGDIPKTASADRYEWNGCYLLDTPGVNAPIEHEELTSEQIDRSELILFVIRQGDQDVQDVYDRMFEMLAMKKQIFIVYNHELSGDDLPSALDRLVSILCAQSKMHGVQLETIGAIPILPVNIKTANTAALKNSEKLAEHSGILQFESAFRAWLQQFDDEYHYLDHLRKRVEHSIISPLKQKIDSKLTGEESVQIDILQHKEDQVVQQFDLLDVKTRNFVRSELNQIKPQLAKFLSCSENQFELQAGVDNLALQLVNATSDFLTQCCDEIEEELDAHFNLNIDAPSESDSGSKISEAVQETVIAGLKQVDQEIIKKGFLLLRKMKFPPLKGRWEQTIGKMAGKANFALTLGLAAYEIFSASRSQDKANDQEKQQALKLHSIVETISADIGATILQETGKVIRGAKQESLETIRSQIGSVKAELSQQAEDKTQVYELEAALKAVRIS